METFAGFKNFKVLDFNEDGYADFVLYGINKNRFAINRSLKNGKISAPKNKFFFYPITEICKLRKRENFGSFYVIISRPQRLAALTSFTKYGTLQLLNVHRFDSFPSGLFTADLNGDGRKEALVFGSNFNGITELTEEKFILKEKKIVENASASHLLTMDFNYDRLTDVIYYDVFSSSLHLLKNNGEASFNEERSIRLFDSPVQIKKTDFNNDGFEDLALLFKHKFVLMFGDSVSSFSKELTLQLTSAPAGFVPFDVNSDGLKDFVFIFPQEKSVEVSFNENKKKLSPLRKIFTGKKIVDAFTGKEDFNKGKIYFYNSAGQILEMLKKSKTPNVFTFVGNGKAENVFLTKDFLLFEFSDSSELSKDYYYWGTLNSPVFYSDKYSLDSSFISIPFQNNSSIFELSFKVRKSLILLKSFNVRNGQTNLALQHLEEKIIDVQPFKIKKERQTKLAFLLTDSTGQLNIKTFVPEKDSLTITGDGSFFTAERKSLKNKLLPYSVAWQNSEDSTTTLVEYLTKTHRLITSKRKFVNGDFFVNLVPNVKLNEHKNYGIVFKQNKIKFYLGEKETGFYRLPDSIATVLRNNRNIKNFYDSNTKKQFCFAYDKKRKTLFKIVYLRNKKIMKIGKAIESKKINDYFITPFNKNKVYIIYTDNNGVTFEELNEN